MGCVALRSENFFLYSQLLAQNGYGRCSGPITSVVNFLASLHKVQLSTVCTFYGVDFLQHSHNKEVFTNIMTINFLMHWWDGRAINVNRVTLAPLLDSLGDDDTLSLKQLTWKVAMLLALTSPSRSTDLSTYTLQYTPDGVTLLPSCLAKQSQQGKPLSELFFPTFPTNSPLCPVTTLRAYEERMESHRNDETKLFSALIKPHKSVTSCMVARWLKALLIGCRHGYIYLQTWALQLTIS